MPRETTRPAGRAARTDAGVAPLETLFKALGDRTRLRILGLLIGGEVCVCDIHESLRIPQPKASRHLAYLRRAGLVEARKKGLWVHYRLAPDIDAVRGAVVDAVNHALGHVPAIARDRQRLDRRTGCCAPIFGIVSSMFACCAPTEDVADLKFSPPTEDAAELEFRPTTDSTMTTDAVTASTPASPAGTADDRPRSPDPSSSGEPAA